MIVLEDFIQYAAISAVQIIIKVHALIECCVSAVSSVLTT
jgi:hypothetical protein